MLLVLLRTVIAGRERENQRVIALSCAELPQCARVIRQLIVGKCAPRNDVRTHLRTPSMKMATKGSSVPALRMKFPGEL